MTSTDSPTTTPQHHDAVTSQEPEGSTVKKTLTTTQRWVLGLAIVPMIAVGVAGGIGTFTNISGAYGKGTAVGALAAGEGATAVLALILLGLTLLGQSSPLVVRLGLWVLPAVAAVMGATAAKAGTGQAIVFAATPLAITASAEGLAFLVRRIVVHQEGRDAEAEARDAAAVRDLAYHQARAARHPKEKVKKRSELKSWKIARRVGRHDISLGTALLDVQRGRMTTGADVALMRMYGLDATDTTPALAPASATGTPALPSASTDDATTPQRHDASIQAETSGYPLDTDSDQAEETKTVRPDLKVVQGEKKKRPSIAADVRQMVADGVQDVRHVVDAIASRHGRAADDPTLQQTVNRYWREANNAKTQESTATEPEAPGQYL